MPKQIRLDPQLVASFADRLFASIMIAALCAARATADDGSAPPQIGADGSIGCRSNPTRVKQLVITEPGVYENYLVDGEWSASVLVRITADDVILRNCEIRRGRHNALEVYAKHVVIESCRIQQMLAGTFEQQKDAHGVTGCPTGLVIRNCDIGLVSGDAVQFDPDRGAWDDVLIERCTLWTGPLPEDAADFRKGERPGENALDTKQLASNPRSRITIDNCLMHGWNQPGQISNMAALNLKNNVEAVVRSCVLRNNEICFRVRGGTAEYGGARVSIEHCAVYDSAVAVRAEDMIEDLTIRRLGIGSGIVRRMQLAGGGVGPGYENVEEYSAPAFETVLETGLPP